MAVQAQYPSNALLPNYRNNNRVMRSVFGGDNNRSVSISPLNFNQRSCFLDECSQRIHPPNNTPAAGDPGSNLSCTFDERGGGGGGGGGSHVRQPALLVNATLFNGNNYNEADNEITCTLLSSRKRPRELAAADAAAVMNHRQQGHQQHQLLNQSRQPQQQQQHQQQQLDISHYQNHHVAGRLPDVVMPRSTGVSTGLHLTFEDDRLNSTSLASTSGRENVSLPLLSIVGEEDLSAHIQQQSEEIKLLFKAQGQQVCQLLEEKRQWHSRALLAAIEEGLSQFFQKKDLEIENVKRQNLQLTEYVKQLSLVAHHWEAKATTTEAMVTALRSNLQQAQQAVAFSREQSKEGCGDSEADDAASSHHGDDPHAQTFKENRELHEQRTCRVCHYNDVSILLLPCRHLCLCKECEACLDACPLCRSLKNASVQVYMS
ncbi:hypothetical protein CY35_03G077900 [Sphagnum magellanicum]|nr:hypothetical protein CY35_03G077900 [Sphagnum magellanicum]